MSNNIDTTIPISFNTVNLFTLKCIRTFKSNLQTDKLDIFDKLLMRSCLESNNKLLSSDTVNTLLKNLDVDEETFHIIVTNIFNGISDFFKYNVHMHSTANHSDILRQIMKEDHNSCFKFSNNPVSDKSIIEKIFLRFQSSASFVTSYQSKSPLKLQLAIQFVNSSNLTKNIPIHELVDKYCNWKIKHDGLTGITVNTNDFVNNMSTLGLLLIDDMITKFYISKD